MLPKPTQTSYTLSLLVELRRKLEHQKGARMQAQQALSQGENIIQAWWQHHVYKWRFLNSIASSVASMTRMLQRTRALFETVEVQISYYPGWDCENEYSQNNLTLSLVAQCCFRIARLWCWQHNNP